MIAIVRPALWRMIQGFVPGIDLIVGGHSHTEVRTPVSAGGTLIVQAGYYGRYLGVMQLAYYTGEKRIVSHIARKVLAKVKAGPTDGMDEAVAALIKSYDDKIRADFSRVVGETLVDLRKRPYESNLGNLVCDAMREATGADAAIQNNGGIRATIPKGKITLEQAYTLLPFDNTLITVQLTGEQVSRILEQNAATEGMLQVSGIRVVYDLSAPEGSRDPPA